MVANILADSGKFIVLLAAVLAIGVVFPFVLMIFFRAVSLGSPTDKLNTIRKVK